MIKRKIAILSVIAIVTSSLMLQDVSVFAKTQAEIDKEIEQNNNKINELEKEQDSIKSRKSEQQSVLDELRQKLNEKSELLNEVQGNLNKAKKEISELETSIVEVGNNITEVEGQIVEKQEEIEVKQEILGKRLRGMYKYDIGNQILDILLQSDSFGDLVSALSSISAVVKTDNKLINEIEAIKSELLVKESELNSKKEELAQDKDKLQVTKAEYEVVAKGYEDQVNELATLESARMDEINKLTSEEKALQTEIARYEEDNENLENYFNNTSNSGGGDVSTAGFIRPAGGGITSSYGPRIHPISGQQSFHKGVDLGSGYGTPFVATKAGTVTTASYISGYGNTVIIDHGGGVTSLYAHASKLNVSVGQQVSQGQTVALIGSTGNSTGPHAHFEIRVNGQHVNPMNYIN